MQREILTQRRREAETQRENFNAKVQRGKGRKEQRKGEKKRRILCHFFPLSLLLSLSAPVKLPPNSPLPLQNLKLEELPLHWLIPRANILAC
jgi:hypothetical protein